MLFCARIEYQTPDDAKDRRARSTAIYFESNNQTTAAAEVPLWFANRSKALPDHFHKLCAYKVYVFAPQRVQATGYLELPTNFPCYEWKYDFGWPAGWTLTKGR